MITTARAVGLTLGYPEKAGQPKPRLPLASYAHFETYHANALPAAIDHYDDELIAHWKKIGRGDGETWSSSVTSYYKSIYFPLIAKIAKEQGFNFDL